MGSALTLVACERAPTPEQVCEHLGPITWAIHAEELARVPEGPGRESLSRQHEEVFANTWRQCPTAMAERRCQTCDAKWKLYASCILAAKTGKDSAACD